MANSQVAVTEGSGKNIDTRTTTTDGDHRQVIIVGDPSVDNAVAGVVSADPGPTSSAYGQIVRLAGSAQVQIAGSAGSLSVYFDRGNPSVTIDNRPDVNRVFNVIDGTISLPSTQSLNTITRVDRVFNVVAGTMTVSSVTGSIGVYFDRSNPAVNANISGQSSTLNIQLDPGHTLGNIGSLASVTGSVGVYFSGSSPTVKVVNGATTMIVAFDSGKGFLQGINTTVNVALDPGHTLGAISSVAGTVAVYFDKSNPAVNAQFANIGHTAGIFCATGSSAAATTSGITVISPSANYNFKIFAYSIQTTGVLASALTFADGNSAGQVEFWRPLVATGGSGTQSTTPIGANMAVTPPGYLFATGTSKTLVIAGNNGATIHYSVAYIKETA